MPKAERYVGELLLKLLARETGEISKVDYNPQKTAFHGHTYTGETALERRSPESQGVSSAFFCDLLRTLSKDKGSNIHKFMALRHGYVIAECAFEPFDMDMWHVSYSMCKSIVGMAIGILIDEEKLSLDTRLQDVLGSKLSPFGFFKKSITVQNLLNMSAGVEFNEAGALSGNDWRKSYLESALKFEPGTRFEYNSMNTYMLSAIVTEITGKSLFDFCKERIFDPMGIKRVFWESCPQSITKGGWGLFIRAEDMAKLGQLYLNKGNWNGTQIVSKEWVEQSISWQIETDREDNKHYGYQLWINDDRPGSYAYNGMLGQNVFVYPDIDMVIVTNGGNQELFQTSSMATNIRNYMKDVIEPSEVPLPEDFSALTQLKALCRSFDGRSRSFPTICGGGWKNRRVRMSGGHKRSVTRILPGKDNDRPDLLLKADARNEKQLLHSWIRNLDGLKYDFETSGLGLFPLMMQIVHNNFTDGIRSIGFRVTKENAFYMDVYEGEAIFRLRLGFDGANYVSDINMHSENYKVVVKSLVKRDEYNRIVLRNDLYFVEEACSRSLNIYFDPADMNRIELRMTETPGTGMLMEAMDNFNIEGAGLESAIINRFIKGGMKSVFTDAIKNMLQPVFYASLENPYLDIPMDAAIAVESDEEDAPPHPDGDTENVEDVEDIEDIEDEDGDIT